MTAVMLLVAALVSLGLGGYVQLDDTSDAGSGEWVLPLGALAAVLALSALVVAIRDREERRPLAGALGLTTIGIVYAAAVDDGFRFIWHGSEGELGLFVAVSVWTSLALFAVGGLRPAIVRGAPAPLALRLVLYLFSVGAVVMVAMDQGARDFSANECRGGGECDLAGLEALAWGAVALLLSVAAIALYEIVRHDRLRRSSKV